MTEKYLTGGSFLYSWLKNAWFKGSFQAVKTRKVALSFDDGPSADITPKVLDILNKRNIHATFFWIAQNAQELKINNPTIFAEIMRKIKLGGHEIGYHGPRDYILPFYKRWVGQFKKDELLEGKRIIEKLIGEKLKLYRTHILHFGPSIQTIIEMDLIPIFGDLMHFPKPGDSVTKQIKVASGIKPGSILGLHDSITLTSPENKILEVLPELLDNLKMRGLKPTTVSDVLSKQ